MKKNNFKIVKIDKNKSLFNYEKKILIKELTLDLKLGYYEFEKEKPQKVKFSLEIDYEDKKPTSDKDIKSIVNYGQVVKLIKKLTKNKHYNFLSILMNFFSLVSFSFPSGQASSHPPFILSLIPHFLPLTTISFPV